MRGASAIRGGYLSRLGLQHRDEGAVQGQMGVSKQASTVDDTRGEEAGEEGAQGGMEGSQHGGEDEEIEDRAQEAEVSRRCCGAPARRVNTALSSIAHVAMQQLTPLWQAVLLELADKNQQHLRRLRVSYYSKLTALASRAGLDLANAITAFPHGPQATTCCRSSPLTPA